MVMERYFQETAAAWNDSDEDGISLDKWESVVDTVDEPENNPSGGFDCNICLDIVQDPVVTFCGHLYCWPCIYKWMQFQSVSAENPDQQQPQCPVCKAEVSQRTLIPLYGRGQAAKSSEEKGSHLGIVVPQRPSSAYGIHTPVTSAIAHSSHPAQQFRRHRSHPQEPRSYHPHRTLRLAGVTTDSLNPMAGMSGERVYAWIFGNHPDSGLYAYPNSYHLAGSNSLRANSYHLAGSNSLRVRRHIMQADQSLNRISFFLLCCAVLCLLLF